HGARIVNMSLVYTEEINKKFDLWRNDYANILLKYPDLLIVVAAGNEAVTLEEKTIFPAGLALNHLLTVGAYDTYIDSIWFEEDRRGSNTSDLSVDLLAPGVFITSFSVENSFEAFTGTSMASPIVANWAAKILLSEPQLTAEQLKSRILASATSIPAMKK